MDLTRKARFFAGDHMTTPQIIMTCTSVVSRESDLIHVLLAALNKMDMLTCDIDNAYLNVYTTGKIYYRVGPEWSPALEGTLCVIIRALYGLKINANAWRQALCHTLNKKMG